MGEIIPCFVTIRSNSEPVFIQEVVQLVAKELKLLGDCIWHTVPELRENKMNKPYSKATYEQTVSRNSVA